MWVEMSVWRGYKAANQFLWFKFDILVSVDKIDR